MALTGQTTHIQYKTRNAAFTFPRRWCKRLGIPIYAISLIAYKGSGRDMKIYLGIRGKKAATSVLLF